MTEPKEHTACREKTKLFTLYQQATEIHSEAVRELARKISTSSKIQYDELYRIAADAERTSTRARMRLEEHIAEHGC